MQSPEHSVAPLERHNPFTGADVLALLRENAWLTEDALPEVSAWADRAAFLLGPHCESREHLAALLSLVFHYDAKEILQQTESHATLARYAARDVIRHLALHLVDPAPFTSEYFKEVVNKLKEELDLRSRDLFYPIRLSLAGRVGEGELDRVILLLDDAAALPFAVRVKTNRERMLEFCENLD
jgi:hypothetical protein